MYKIVKTLPLPIVGLMLGFAALGNLVLSYGSIYRNIFGIISGIILVLVLLKIFKYPSNIKEDLKNPVVASVFPTLSMGIMLLSTYVPNKSIGFIMWIIGLLLHIGLIVWFSVNFLRNFNIKKVFPSWFIVYVGIAVASLCLAGYMNSFQEKNMAIVWLLLAFSQLLLFFVLFKLPGLLKSKFYPSYSAFTFPLVISGVALKLTNGFLTNTGNTISFFKYLIKFEELVALVMVLYVFIRYVNFVFFKKESTKA